MAYLALYRAFRPETLDGVVRQEHIVKILRNQLANDRVGHAYLFCGPRGTGKTSVAKIFARAVNCLSPVNGSPCGTCASCRALAAGNSLDVVEIDAASNNGVDEMRDLREKVQYPPVNGRYKVYIVDEVHMLSAGAFNALLKTLEEPPRHAVFILATTESQKIPATILSRCMRFDFKLIPQEDLENHLKNILNKLEKPYEEEAVAAIARAGAGSVRDMLSIADICVSYESGPLTYAAVNAVLGSADFSLTCDLCSSVLNGDMPAALALTEKLFSEGKGIGVLVRDVLQFLNNCAIAKMCRGAEKILSLPREMFRKIKSAADSADGHALLRACEIFAEVESKLRYSSSPRILLETAVMKSSMPQTDYNLDALLARVSALEEKLAQGAFVPAENKTAGKSTLSVQKETVEEQPASSVFSSELPAYAEEDFPPLPEEPVFGEEYGGAEPVTETAVRRPAERKSFVAREEPVLPVQIQEVAPMPLQTAQNQAVLSDRSKAFGMFLRSLRKLSKNGVLFTMCSELDSSFEGDVMVFSSESETICRALQRPEHRAAMAQALQAVGVYSFEVRPKAGREDGFKEKLEKLKADFPDVPLQVK